MTEPITTTVTNHEVWEAWQHWLHFHRGINCSETEERFFAYCHTFEQSFADDPLDWDSDQLTFKVCDDTAKRVKQAAGPHFNTIFEAYYAKHPW